MSGNKKLTIALAGNPNCGKSTIFNNLTGSRQHVGNYPGVTVEKKEGGVVYKDYNLTIVDLPGTYSLSAYSEDEVVARDYIVKEKPDVVVHILDSSNLERNLYLYTQLAEFDVPIVLAMNMSDIAEKKGHSIDYNELSRLLGKPIVKTVGSKNKGTEDLLETVLKLYDGRIKIEKIKIDYGEEIEQELKNIIKLLSKSKKSLNQYPVKWIAIKLLENDSLAIDVIKKLSNEEEILDQIEKSRHHLKLHFEDDPEVMIADRRYGFISGACTQSVRITVEERHDLSDQIDKIILNRFLGLPIFAAVMYGIFKFTFTFSGPVVGWFESLFEWMGGVVASIFSEGLVQSFLVDGIIGGVGGVLGFFPLVLFMFFAIAFFEDSGYMARAAFVMDKIMSKFGLHGKSFLPMMISTNGCAVPGIMATRTLDSKKDRLITMMVTPFMICGAKLPIFALFIGAFFPSDQGANMMFLMYVLSLLLAFGSAWILKQFVFKGEIAHFVMELPPYRIPTLKGLLLKMWERGWLYIKKAGTVILLISIIVWAGFTFPQMDVKDGISEESVASMQMEQSFAGRIGKLIEPAVKPLGLDWRSGVALIAGVVAKEVVVSTFGTMYRLGEIDPEEADTLQEALIKDTSWSPLKALSFLMFCLIYMPCFVAMAVFYRESGSSWKWTCFLVFWTTIMAWSASFLVYQVGTLLGFGG
ncbi:MAG: ferrous iron transport protein B [Candidatus Aureabacteria bacterium]|nr:ferrous iron transport protein B [Candidatus Auribacterota bacterium]